MNSYKNHSSFGIISKGVFFKYLIYIQLIKKVSHNKDISELNMFFLLMNKERVYPRNEIICHKKKFENYPSETILRKHSPFKLLMDKDQACLINWTKRGEIG